MINNIDLNKVIKEISFRTSRSRGKGGQNVNKVETKVELIFNIANSLTLTNDIKEKLLKKLRNKIDSENNLRIVVQKERTQLANKKLAIDKLAKLLENALKRETIRIKTIKSVSAKEKTLEEKRKHSLKKQLRQLGNDIYDE